jgi:hypothetical protein
MPSGVKISFREFLGKVLLGLSYPDGSNKIMSNFSVGNNTE